jgi:tetratricopeptide (TPR) repeat protein
LPVALRTADWAQVSELLKATAPPSGRPNLEFLARQLAGFAAGMLAVETHDLQRAEESSARFDAELWRVSSQQPKDAPGRKAAPGDVPKLPVMPDALLQPLLKSLSVMSLELRASLLAAHGKTGEAKSSFEKAAQEERALGYHEPPSYIRPVGETEGAVMMAVGAWKEAKSAYEQALLERPRSGLVLYGIAMSSEKSGDHAAAAKEYADFLAAWKDADPGLAQVTHAQTYLAEHSASTANGTLSRSAL